MKIFMNIFGSLEYPAYLHISDKQNAYIMENTISTTAHAYSVKFDDLSKYDSLRASERSISQHSYNPDYSYYVGHGWVSVSMTYSGQVMSAEKAQERLEWFMGKVPFHSFAESK